MNPVSSSSYEDQRKKKWLVFAAVVPLAVILVVVGGVIVGAKFKSGAKADAAAQTKCMGKEFAQGASGDCVRDIQTMINFMETDGLTQCPFASGMTLPINGYFGPETEQQVGVVQDWFTCYNKQEDLKIPDFEKGKVTAPTWQQLCTYAYFYPSQNNDTKSSYRTDSLAAGKDAGCDGTPGQ